ncbi:conditioned medium-induced protein 4 [Natronomonas salina]|uniref:conditioned medium-induced protein 4 n=1 Tax=Natronomonas salina TaxID=1710540 RepID=UPI0015B70AD9|nr:conditioned medium-induced protein 4 [Natronomonas salina]QLD88991.1 conditioned medium-induced protein 4 [Natronomonas salina]
MDEKTEELRDIFMDVTDEEAVTERQEESRGSLTDERDAGERIGAIVAQMRERYDFDTELTDDELVGVVEGFYTGASDSEIADDLDVSRRDVFRARLDLHLVRERDTDAPFELAEFRELLSEETPTKEVAAHFDVSPSTVRRYRRVVAARNEARQVSDRFRSEFEDALVDADLAEQFTSDMKDDGLDEATDGMETNVSF